MKRLLTLLAAVVVSLAMAETRAGSSLFSTYDPVSLRIEVPLTDLFARAKQEADYTVDGVLTDRTGGRESAPIPVRISLRGHTSRRDNECTFPKLKVDLSAGNTEGTVISGMKSLKIGTHCGEAADGVLTQKYGRVLNETSPYREAAVYRLLDVLGIPALRARPARITYVNGAESLERNAMLLEGDDEAIKRIGGVSEITPARFSHATEMFSVEDIANLAFAEALIGNFDWCLKFTPDDTYRCDARMKLWNIIGAAMPDGKARPLMYDFDVSGMVAGSHRWFSAVYNDAFVESKSRREIEVIGQLQRTRMLFSRRDLDATRRRFVSKKADVIRTLAETKLDAAGRGQIREYIDAFFREIESDKNFYRPVVVAENVRPRTSSDPNAPPVCTSRGAIPIGTVVGPPLETQGDMIKVILLDTQWQWAPPHKCPPIQTGAVWIEAKAVSRDYPKSSP